MSLISNIGAYSYIDKISSLTVAPSPYNNIGSNYNIVFIGTSNGHLYMYNEYTDVTSMHQIIPTGFTGTLSGEITGLTVDPNGKYLFVNAPYDNHCLRISLNSIPVLDAPYTVSVPIDNDIYKFGDNTGNITVDSQGSVYLVTGNGRSISTLENYGNSFVNLLFLNQGPTLTFKGITLSPNEQRIYAIDSGFGSIYYYDFLSNQPNFVLLTTTGVYSKISNVATSGNNVFYTEYDGIHVINDYLGTILRVAGNGMNTYVPTTNPQLFTLSGTNTVTSDQIGDIYLSASNSFGNSTLYKVMFNLIERNGYQPPPPRQQIPILQPFPNTSCKRVVEPFNPRLRFGWGLTNSKKPLNLSKYVLCCPPPIVNCPVTPFYCPPVAPPVFPPQPTPPIYPITVSTRQFNDHFITTGFRNSISVFSNVLISTSLTFASLKSIVQPALGPLGEVYYMAENGVLSKLYNNKVSWTFNTGQTNKLAGPVVSSKGTIFVTTDYGNLYRLDSNAAVYKFYPIVLGQQIGGSPACITNNAFDYIVASYGNTITAFKASDTGTVWTNKTQTNGELFETSVATDGINVFAGTNNSKIYSYTAELGNLNWIYSIPKKGISPFTPYVGANYIGITVPGDSNIFILSNTTVRVQAYDITITVSGMQAAGPPIISTDSVGNIWAHVITGTGQLYAFGNVYANVSNNGYQYFWSNNEPITGGYNVPVIDSAGFIYTSATNGLLNQYQAYYTLSSAQSPRTNLVLNGNVTVGPFTNQIYSSPLITSQNTMYVISQNLSKLGTNYLYTISS
jgi:PQQ-like domain